MALSITPVVVCAATKGPPPPAPSIYRKAICFPSRDHLGRAAYPFNEVSFLALDPFAPTIQSCRCPFSAGAEKRASVFESGDQARSPSVLPLPFSLLTRLAGSLPKVERMYACFDVVAAVDCAQAICCPS